MAQHVYTIMTLFSGSGGGGLGFLRARSRRGSRFRCIGAFDNDELACKDHELLTGSPATMLDLGAITPAQLRERVPECPDVLFTSAPCKGLSGCLGESLARTEYYQDLNNLTTVGIYLILEAWWERWASESEAAWIARRRRPKLIIFENVPRIVTRGADLLDRITSMLVAAGYVVDQRKHDCGEIGGLAQSRERFLLVARLPTELPSYLQLPPVLGHRAIADLLWQLPVPLPGTQPAGSMHVLNKLAPINWLRLATVRSGRDWRDIPGGVELAWTGEVEPQPRKRGAKQRGGHGVDDPRGRSRLVTAQHGDVANTPSSVADPRIADPRSDCVRREGSIGVVDPALHYPTSVIANIGVENAPAALADPRLAHRPRDTCWDVAEPGGSSRTVIGCGSVDKQGRSVADPRVPERSARHAGVHGVADPRRPAPTVIGKARNGNGWAAVADDRLFEPTHWLTCSAALDSSRDAWTSARFVLEGPEVTIKAKGRPCWMVIVAPDGTFHRPFTTLELAWLQGLSPWHRPGDPTEMAIGEDGGRWLELHGNQDEQREHIGNMVPPPAAQAIAETMLDLLDLGQQWSLVVPGGPEIWVEENMGVSQ